MMVHDLIRDDSSLFIADSLISGLSPSATKKTNGLASGPAPPGRKRGGAKFSDEQAADGCEAMGFPWRGRDH